MKKIVLVLWVLIVTAWNPMPCAAKVIEGRVFGVDFGTVQQGQSVSKTFELDAGLFTLTADTPFEVVQSTVAPFKISPLSGTLQRIRNTVFTVTVPANTLPGAYKQTIRIIVHRNSGDAQAGPLIAATVLGFPFQITPPDSLNLGTVSTGTIQIKHIGGTPESYSVRTNGTYDARPVTANINPGQTQVITVLPGQGFPNSGTANDVVRIKHVRTGEERQVAVTGTVAGKPDLVPGIFAVKVFPRAAGETKTKIQVTYKVQNAGFQTSAACAGKITLDNDKVLDISVPALSPGQTLQDPSTTKLFETTLTGSFKVKVVVDTNDQNNELVENNNVAIQDIVIP